MIDRFKDAAEALAKKIHKDVDNALLTDAFAPQVDDALQKDAYAIRNYVPIREGRLMQPSDNFDSQVQEDLNALTANDKVVNHAAGDGIFVHKQGFDIFVSTTEASANPACTVPYTNWVMVDSSGVGVGGTGPVYEANTGDPCDPATPIQNHPDQVLAEPKLFRHHYY